MNKKREKWFCHKTDQSLNIYYSIINFTKVIKILNIQKKILYKIFAYSLLFFLFAFISISRHTVSVIKEDNTETLNLPIIMYHSILTPGSKLGKFVISTKELEDDLKYLTSQGYNTIFMNDLIDYVYSEKELPEKPIILTFDDGYYNNYLYAFPLMKKYNCKMVISPIGKCIDIYSENSDKHPAYAHVTWDNLKEMQDSNLVEIQNHSYNMHKCKNSRIGTKIKKGESIHEYKKKLMEDIGTLQEKINLNLNTIPTTFTYPFGAITESSKEILKEMGFKATLTCENKMNKISHDPECLYGLYRFIRPSGISSEKFFHSKIRN